MTAADNSMQHEPAAFDADVGESAFAGLASMLVTISMLQAMSTQEAGLCQVGGTETRFAAGVLPSSAAHGVADADQTAEDAGEVTADPNSRIVRTLQRSCGLAARGPDVANLADLVDLADAALADAFAARQSRRTKRHSST